MKIMMLVVTTFFVVYGLIKFNSISSNMLAKQIEIKLKEKENK